MSDSMLKKVFRGILWRSFGRWIPQILQLIFGAVLARLLTSREFGLIAMIQFFSIYISRFSQLGLGAALIQKDEVDEAHFNSVYWMNICIGLVLTGVMAAISPFIASFYGEPQLLMLSIVLSATFFIFATVTTHRTIFSRNLDFARPTLAVIFSRALAGGGAIVFALQGAGVWALVYRSLIVAVAYTGLLWLFSKWRPRFQFLPGVVKGLLRFGLNLQGAQLVEHLSRNTDKLIIGKYINAAALGYYDRAFQFLLLSRHFSVPLHNVLFPAFSRIKDDLTLVRTGYLHANRYLFLVTLPLMLGVSILAEELIIVFYGDRWYPSVPLVKILCLGGAVQPIENTTGWIFLSQGRSDIQFRLSILRLGVIIISLFIGLRWGIKGVALSYTLATVVLAPISLHLIARMIKFSWREFFRQLLPAFACTAIMGMGVYACRNQLYLFTDMKAIVLICSTGVGVVTYAIANWFINREAILEFRALIRRAI